ncbi:SCY1-like protein 2 isoform X2 [Ooceraea biroi]|uniref:SCY1-like protein 2 isoform X2 n=1 Tax=Ooceraea biroi TaxID=2015173 RepID=UPI000F0913FE|nr:SCY1-like protein 2 isoform X2 [Ooceraea biroi]
MFAKSRGSGTAPCDLLPDTIRKTYEIGKQSATAGPENVWRIYDGYRKKDRMEISIFLFDKRSVEKIHKPKRKDAITDILRESATRMERISHPKLLQVYKVEECADTLAFASEPVLASLSNVLAYKEQLANTLAAQSSGPMGKQNHPPASSHHRSVFIKEYELLELEIKYGLLQITEALLFLHGNCKLFHRNVCPTSIIITKRGTWKLSGFEFIERINENNLPITVQPWTKHMPKMTQPNLDYIAPEVQQKKLGSFSSDMYSLGMTICAIYNQGRPLIQANHSCSDYLKQLDALDEQVSLILPLVPIPLREAVTRLLHKDPEQRPTAQVLTMIKFFRDPFVHALQFLDVSKMKDVHQKEHFYTTTLKELLPYMPKKLWYQHIWTYLHAELQTQEVLSAVLQPMLYIVENSTQEEYDQIVFPTLKPLFTNRKSIQGTVTLLENLHLILQKTPQEYEREVLSMLYMSFENSTIQVRTAAFVAVSHVTQHLEDDAIRNVVLPKLLEAFDNNSADARVLMDVVPCILSRLEKQKIIDCILPLLCKVKLQEPEIVVRVVNIYRLMLTDKKYGLSVNWMAAHAMPSLLPQTVNPALNLEQFILLLEVLQDMLNNIERNQRNKLTLDDLSLPSPDKYRPLRHQYSTDNVHVPAFNIPNLRIEQRKTSSAEDMARKNSIGSISTASAENMARKSSMTAMFGNWFTSASANDSNFLRVANTFTSRRLSDNTLMTPKIRIAPSCASSPGGTPGGGLPIRRHSSTGPQERRGSNINLSPPTGGGMPITSSSVPYLLSSSLNSIRGSRRPSVSSTSSQQGIGLLQQVGSSMVRQLPPICLNLNGPPPPPTHSPSLQLPGQHSH